MSIPINQLNLRTQVLTPDLISANASQDFVPSYLRLKNLDLAAIKLTPPTVAVPQSETYGLHDAHEKETGATVSYDPTDASSLWGAAEELAKSPSSQDKFKAQELFMKFQEILQLQIQKASILHDMAMSAIKAMRG
jgi:hypothetical protein